MTKYILLFLFLNSCALISIPSYTTSHGIKIHDKTRLDISRAKMELVVSDFVKSFNLNSKDLDGTHIYLFSKLIQIPNGDNEFIMADGFTDIREHTILLSVFTECLGNSAIVHELAHLIFMDGNHTNKELWDRVKQIESDLRVNCTSEQIELDKRMRDPSEAIR